MAKSTDTRTRLERQALDLFTRQGYDSTTVAEIAAAAGVSHMTFFRYFPTKEAVVVGDPYDPVIGASVAEQPAGMPPLERARRGLLAALSQIPEPDDTATRTRIRLIAAHPGLRARMWENNHATQEVIAAALRDGGADPLAASVAAGACVGALMVALLDWGTRDGAGTLADRVRYALDLLAPRAGAPEPGGPA